MVSVRLEIVMLGVGEGGRGGVVLEQDILTPQSTRKQWLHHD